MRPASLQALRSGIASDLSGTPPGCPGTFVRWSCGDLCKREGQIFDCYKLGFPHALVLLNWFQQVSQKKGNVKIWYQKCK